MELKVWCPTCNGKGTEFPHVRGRDECDDCSGKGYTNPPQQVLDDLECAEIERELVLKNVEYDYIYCKNYAKNKHVIWVKQFVQGNRIAFRDKTKLGALLQAKAWLDEKDGE